MSIQTEGMLVSVKVSQWSARKLDREASVETAHRFGANNGAGRFNKQLISKDALKDVAQAGTALKRYFYKVTVPWSSLSNQHLLSSRLYFDFTQEMRSLKSNFDAAADRLAAQYGVLVQEAVLDLNGLYKPSDYPAPDEIRQKFSVDIEMAPVPDGDHLLRAIEGRELEKMKEELNATVEKKTDHLKREVWERLFGVVKSMEARLADDKAVFRDTLVGNITDLCALLPALNVTNDPALEDMRLKVESQLTTYTPDDLRSSDTARKDTARAAKEIRETMAGFMGPV